MRIGLYLNPSTPGPADDGRRIREVLGQCRLAEELGYDSIWLTEQHFTPYNTYSDSLVLASYLAAATRRVLLGFAVLVPSLHHPVRLAEQIGLLDQLSEGRIVFGLGVGAVALELAGFGVEFEHRHAAFDEATDLLFRLLRHNEGRFEYVGDRLQGVIEGRVIPRPYRLPHPPIARATVHPETAETWGKMGQPILIGSLGDDHIQQMIEAHERGLRQSALDVPSREAIRNLVAIHHIIFLAETDEQARREFEPYFDAHLENFFHANRSFRAPRYELPADRIERYRAHQTMVGSPETILARLRQEQSLGVRHLMVWANVGNLPDALVRRTLTLLSEHVVPRLKAEGGRRQAESEPRQE